MTSPASPEHGRRRPPSWAARLHRAAWRALTAGPADGGVALNVAIDLHKVLTGPLLLGLMAVLDVFTAPVWVYLGLHGSYGVAWVVKDRTFPGRQWQRRVGWVGAVLAWAFLSFYWVAPAILVLGTAGVIEPAGLFGGEWSPAGAAGLGVAVGVYALGLLLMAGSDIQKSRTLELRPGELITTGFYARTRHPNYLGEMMIYGSFALVAAHWLPWLLLGVVWILFFVPNMLAIDASLSRYPEYTEWEARTGFLLPKLF